MNNEILNNYIKIKNDINNLKKENNISYEITLLPVSKTKPYEDMKILLDNNINLFGENYVQEIIEKYNINNNINFQLIGHLQTNKVKSIIDKVSLIESCDSLKLISLINKESEKINKISDILLEVNAANEETKYGFKLEEVKNIIEEIKDLKSINLKGLMTSAPLVKNPNDNEIHFKKLKKLYDEIKKENDTKQNNINFDTLSMGMSNDYKVAIKCGSTEIRVGTNIFGKRDYSNKK